MTACPMICAGGSRLPRRSNGEDQTEHQGQHRGESVRSTGFAYDEIVLSFMTPPSSCRALIGTALGCHLRTYAAASLSASAGKLLDP